MDDQTKPRLRYPVIVEGRYDKIKLDSLFRGNILPTDGFGIFKDREKKSLFLALAKKTPLILAFDPDGGGKVIRRYFSSFLPPDRIFQVYIPQVRGKEPRKNSPSKAGFLGVEGTDAEILRKVFSPYVENGETASEKENASPPLTRTDLFELGLSGREDSAIKRKQFCEKAGLPADLTAPAILQAVNLLYRRDEVETLLRQL